MAVEVDEAQPTAFPFIQRLGFEILAAVAWGQGVIVGTEDDVVEIGRCTQERCFFG